MAKQKKIIDIHENGTHLICIHRLEDRNNSYRIYLVISPTGSPIRKRELIRYEDFMSVLYFLRDFYIYGLNAMPYCDMMEWISSHSA